MRYRICSDFVTANLMHPKVRHLGALKEDRNMMVDVFLQTVGIEMGIGFLMGDV